MKLVRSVSKHAEIPQGTVLAMGNFDGLHCGHRAVLETTKKLAKKHNAPLAVMTFEPHPRRLFKPELPPLRLLPLAEKLRQLREFGVDVVFMLPFTREFSQTIAPEFVQDILQKKLQLKGLVTGDNFIFGHHRQGNRSYLEEQAPQRGFEYKAVKAVTIAAETCSSTRLRGALAGGDMDLATALLGRPYAMIERVMKGDQRGRFLGYPTANLRPAGLFHPAFGVYVARVRGMQDGREYQAISSFGLRPMYALQTPLLETHLLDFKGDLYGQKLTVEFLHYLRTEQKFDSEAALIMQMKQDEAQSRAWFTTQAESAGA